MRLPPPSSLLLVLHQPRIIVHTPLSHAARPTKNPLPRPTTQKSHQTLSFSTRPTLHNSNDADEKSSLLDREAVNTESNEYSKSGSDDGSAAHDDPAFQPGKTDPESERKSSQRGGEGRDPLDVSPANTEVSQPKDPRGEGAERGPERKGGSGSGGGKKGRKVG